MTIIFYLYNFLFTLVFAMYTKYQVQDEKAGFAAAKSRWHRYGMMMRILLMGAFVLHLVVKFTWKDMLLAGVIDMALWDVLINVLALNMPWWYEGQTAAIDKMLKNIKWMVYGALIIVAIIIKFTY